MLEGLKGQRGFWDKTQRKAGMGCIAANCPVCNYWFSVGPPEIKFSMLRRLNYRLRMQGSACCQRWLKEAWGMEFPKTVEPTLECPALGRIHQSVVSKGMRQTYIEHQRVDDPAHLIIAWNDAPLFDDNYACIPIGQFFEVVRRICSIAPHFKRRLQNALESPVGVGNGHQDLGALFDDSAAVRLE